MQCWQVLCATASGRDGFALEKTMLHITLPRYMACTVIAARNFVSICGKVVTRVHTQLALFVFHFSADVVSVFFFKPCVRESLTHWCFDTWDCEMALGGGIHLSFSGDPNPLSERSAFLSLGYC